MLSRKEVAQDLLTWLTGNRPETADPTLKEAAEREAREIERQVDQMSPGLLVTMTPEMYQRSLMRDFRIRFPETNSPPPETS